MDCQKIENILIDYIDGILDQDMQQKVEEHLTACKSCRQVFEQNKQLIADMENNRILQGNHQLGISRGLHSARRAPYRSRLSYHSLLSQGSCGPPLSGGHPS